VVVDLCFVRTCDCLLLRLNLHFMVSSRQATTLGDGGRPSSVERGHNSHAHHRNWLLVQATISLPASCSRPPLARFKENVRQYYLSLIDAPQYNLVYNSNSRPPHIFSRATTGDRSFK